MTEALNQIRGEKNDAASSIRQRKLKECSSRLKLKNDGTSRKYSIPKQAYKEWEALRRKRFNNTLEKLRLELPEQRVCPKVDVLIDAIRHIKEYKQFIDKSQNLQSNCVGEKFRKCQEIFIYILKEAGIYFKINKIKQEVSFTIPAHLNGDGKKLNQKRTIWLNISMLRLSAEDYQVFPSENLISSGEQVDKSSQTTQIEKINCATQITNAIEDTICVFDEENLDNLPLTSNYPIKSQRIETSNSLLNRNECHKGEVAVELLQVDINNESSVHVHNDADCRREEKATTKLIPPFARESIHVIMENDSTQNISMEILKKEKIDNAQLGMEKCVYVEPLPSKFMVIQYQLKSNLETSNCRDFENVIVSTPSDAPLTFVTPSISSIPIMSTGIGSSVLSPQNMNSPILMMQHHIISPPKLKRIAPKPCDCSGPKCPKQCFKNKTSKLLPLLPKKRHLNSSMLAKAKRRKKNTECRLEIDCMNAIDEDECPMEVSADALTKLVQNASRIVSFDDSNLENLDLSTDIQCDISDAIRTEVGEEKLEEMLRSIGDETEGRECNYSPSPIIASSPAFKDGSVSNEGEDIIQFRNDIQSKHLVSNGESEVCRSIEITFPEKKKISINENIQSISNYSINSLCISSKISHGETYSKYQEIPKCLASVERKLQKTQKEPIIVDDKCLENVNFAKDSKASTGKTRVELQNNIPNHNTLNLSNSDLLASLSGPKIMTNLNLNKKISSVNADSLECSKLNLSNPAVVESSLVSPLISSHNTTPISSLISSHYSSINNIKVTEGNATDCSNSTLSCKASGTTQSNPIMTLSMIKPSYENSNTSLLPLPVLTTTPHALSSSSSFVSTCYDKDSPKILKLSSSNRFKIDFSNKACSSSLVSAITTTLSHSNSSKKNPVISDIVLKNIQMSLPSSTPIPISKFPLDPTSYPITFPFLSLPDAPTTFSFTLTNTPNIINSTLQTNSSSSKSSTSESIASSDLTKNISKPRTVNVNTSSKKSYFDTPTVDIKTTESKSIYKSVPLLNEQKDVQSISSNTTDLIDCTTFPISYPAPYNLCSKPEYVQYSISPSLPTISSAEINVASSLLNPTICIPSLLSKAQSNISFSVEDLGSTKQKLHLKMDPTSIDNNTSIELNKSKLTHGGQICSTIAKADSNVSKQMWQKRIVDSFVDEKQKGQLCGKFEKIDSKKSHPEFQLPLLPLSSYLEGNISTDNDFRCINPSLVSSTSLNFNLTSSTLTPNYQNGSQFDVRTVVSTLNSSVDSFLPLQYIFTPQIDDKPNETQTSDFNITAQTSSCSQISNHFNMVLNLASSDVAKPIMSNSTSSSFKENSMKDSNSDESNMKSQLSNFSKKQGLDYRHSNSIANSLEAANSCALVSKSENLDYNYLNSCIDKPLDCSSSASIENRMTSHRKLNNVCEKMGKDYLPFTLVSGYDINRESSQESAGMSLGANVSGITSNSVSSILLNTVNPSCEKRSLDIPVSSWKVSSESYAKDLYKKNFSKQSRVPQLLSMDYKLKGELDQKEKYKYSLETLTIAEECMVNKRLSEAAPQKKLAHTIIPQSTVSLIMEELTSKKSNLPGKDHAPVLKVKPSEKLPLKSSESVETKESKRVDKEISNILLNINTSSFNSDFNHENISKDSIFDRNSISVSKCILPMNIPKQIECDPKILISSKDNESSSKNFDDSDSHKLNKTPNDTMCTLSQKDTSRGEKNDNVAEISKIHKMNYSNNVNVSLNSNTKREHSVKFLEEKELNPHVKSKDLNEFSKKGVNHLEGVDENGQHQLEAKYNSSNLHQDSIRQFQHLSHSSSTHIMQGSQDGSLEINQQSYSHDIQHTHKAQNIMLNMQIHQSPLPVLAHNDSTILSIASQNQNNADISQQHQHMQLQNLNNIQMSKQHNNQLIANHNLHEQQILQHQIQSSQNSIHETINQYDNPIINSTVTSEKMQHISHHHSPMGSSYMQSFDYNSCQRKATTTPRGENTLHCNTYKSTNHYSGDLLVEQRPVIGQSQSIVHPLIDVNEDLSIREVPEESPSDAIRNFSVNHLVSGFNSDGRKSNIVENDSSLNCTEEKTKESKSKVGNKRSESKIRTVLGSTSKVNNQISEARRRSPARSSSQQTYSNHMWNQKNSSQKHVHNYSAEAILSTQNHSRSAHRQAANQNYHLMPPNQVYHAGYSSHQMKNFVQNSSFGYGAHERSGHGMCQTDYNFQLHHAQPAGALSYGGNMPYMAGGYPYQNLPSSSSSSMIAGDLVASHGGPYPRSHEITQDQNFNGFSIPIESQDMCNSVVPPTPPGFRTAMDTNFYIPPSLPSKGNMSKSNNNALSASASLSIGGSTKRGRYTETTGMGSVASMATPTNFFEGSALSHIPIHSFTPPCEDPSLMHSNFFTGPTRHQSNFLLGSENFIPLNTPQYPSTMQNNAFPIAPTNTSMGGTHSHHFTLQPSAAAPHKGGHSIPTFTGHGTAIPSMPFNSLRMGEKQQAPSIGPHLSSSLANFNMTSIIPDIDGKSDGSDRNSRMPMCPPVPSITNASKSLRTLVQSGSSGHNVPTTNSMNVITTLSDEISGSSTSSFSGVNFSQNQ